MGWGEDRPSWAWAPAARCTTTVLLERPFEETSRSASGARTSSELGGCTPCGGPTIGTVQNSADFKGKTRYRIRSLRRRAGCP